MYGFCETIDILLMEGVNKKNLTFLGEMTPKLWPPPVNSFREQKKIFFFFVFFI